MIKSWMQGCDKNHEACRVPKSAFLPTRVIDVGLPSTLDASQDQKDITCQQVSLVAPAKQTSGVYASLSHCWGPVQVIRALMANLDDRMKGIPMSDLPQTFQDAVLVTRRLGIQYLWIDSLCIIQDDNKDWERESAQMANIYRNSTINLAATGAFDGSIGFRLRRSLLEVSTLHFEGSPMASHMEPEECSIRSFYGNFEYGLYNRNIEGPLSTRAWVFQERVLPSRTLHFLPGQIVWECRLAGATERAFIKSEQRRSENVDLPGKISFQLDLFKRFGVFLPGLEDKATSLCNEMPQLALDFSPEQRQRINSYLEWYEMLSTYSKRKLTYAKDRLPAIWALAQVTQRLTSDEYIAGLWKKDLIIGLSFERVSISEPNSKHTSEQRDPKAPSWSWVAIEGMVEQRRDTSYNGSRGTNGGIAKCVNIQVSTYGSPSMGRTSRAALTITGEISSMSCKREYKVWKQPSDHSGSGPLPKFDVPELPTERSLRSLLFVDRHGKLVGRVVFDSSQLADRFKNNSDRGLLNLHLKDGFGIAITRAGEDSKEYVRVGSTVLDIERGAEHIWKKSSVVII